MTKTNQPASVDSEFIGVLVESFYTRVRRNNELGPIFDKVVSGNWAPHLATMKSFWSSVILRSGAYSGRPVPAHMALKGLTPAHFDTWLRLFEETLNELSGDAEITGLFMSKARLIARSLQMALWGPNGKPKKSLRVL